MRFVLIFNPFKYKVHEENLRVVQKYFGLFPPLSLAWVAAIAEKAGHEVIIVDARTLNLSKQQTLERLKRFNPDILGFMMTTYMFPDTMDWIRFLKKHLDLPVVIGGYNLRTYPHESVSHPEIDFGIHEHAYYTIPALLGEIESGNPSFDKVPGLVYKKAGKTIVTPHPQQIDFDKFPNPARHLLPNELYAEFPTERRNFTVMVTSLGCPYACSFCEAGRTQYNPRSPETVIKEIEECYHRYNIREIDIFDYEFTVVRERVMEICRLLQEKGMDIEWACRSRVDTVDKELLSEMQKAGCRRIYFGLESGAPGVLKGINKGISISQVEQAVGACRDLGIRSLGFFLIGAPHDTEETVKSTVAFAKRLNLDYVQFSKCLAKPLTPLWQEMVKSTNRDYWRDWILGREKDRELPRPWTSLTNQQINELTRWAYISYHTRPSYIFEHIKRLRSFQELGRKARAFLDMAFRQEKAALEDKGFEAFNENSPDKIEKLKKEYTARG